MSKGKIVLAVKEKGKNFYGTTVEVRENSNHTYGISFILGFDFSQKYRTKLFHKGKNKLANKRECWDFVKELYKETAKEYARMKKTEIHVLDVCRIKNMDSIEDLDFLFSVNYKIS